MRQIRMLLSWCLALFLLAILTHFLAYPWIGEASGNGLLRDAAGENVFFADLADKTGLSDVEPMGRYAFAGFGVFAGICLLIPPFRKAGAWLSILLFGAVAALMVSPFAPTMDAGDQGASASQSEALLYLALASITAGFLLLVVHPAKRLK